MPSILVTLGSSFRMRLLTIMQTSLTPRTSFVNVRAALAWLLHVETNDPVRRVLNRGMAVIAVVVIGLIPCMMPVYLATNLSTTAIISILTAAIIITGVWWMNRKGSPFGAVLFSITICSINVISYDPQTYVSVQGNPVTHAGLLFPVALVTAFANPWWGLWIVLAQSGALALRGVADGFPPDQTTTFLIVSITNLLAVYLVLATTSAIFRQAVRTSAELTVSLEEKVANRTAALERAHNSRIETMLTVAHDMRNLLQMRDGDLIMLRYAIADAKEQLPTSFSPAPRRRRQAIPARMHRARKALVETEGLLEALEFSTSMLAGAMTDLKESAMASSGQFALSLVDTDVGQLSRSVVTEFAGAFQREGLKLTLELDPDTPAVPVDAPRLKRVMHNIIGNALKHTHGQGSQVTIRLRPEGQGVLWQCQDNGGGMDEATLARLGELFFCAQRGEEAPEGTGIGLYFSLQIVEQHGGTITFASEGLGQGTTVSVWLPQAAKEGA